MSWALRFSWRKRLLLVVALLLVGVLVWEMAGSNVPAPTLTTAPVQRGDLLATVPATGTIEPEEVVDVGAQVLGIITEFGRDPKDSIHPVDYGTQVEVGTILARIDDSLYRARLDKAAALVEQVKSQIAQAEADLLRAEANATQAGAKAKQAARDWARAEKAFATGAASQQEYDAAQSAYEVTKADVAVSEAAIRQARAVLNSAKKSLLAAEADQREAQKNLDYTVIRSPVKGVIVDRRVNVGQTVVSSLNAPSLFLIAKDLRRLQVWASVNEADVGRIRAGQPVRFTVDAFPGEEFRGEVSQVRLNATMTQNVVTYTVVVTTDNSSGKLLPYLTATLRFEVGRRTNALLVPNAALRWLGPQPSGKPPQPGVSTQSDRGTVWILEKGSIQPAELRIGLTDGIATEVVEGNLHEGDAVVVGQKSRAEETGTVNPFTPNILGGKK